MKKTVSRILLLLTSILAVSLILAACGDKTPAATVDVSFVAGEQTVKTATVAKGGKLFAADVPADPELPGYEFDGWFVGDAAFTGAEVFEEDTTVTARLTRLYTVGFVVGDATVKSVSVRAGQTLGTTNLPADPALPGYDFDGWFAGDTAFTGSEAISADTTVTARLTQVHTVSFVAEGTTVKTARVRDGEQLAAADLPADPQKEDYAFLGWLAGGAAFDPSAAVTADLEVTASFEQAVFTVRFAVGEYVRAVKTDASGYLLRTQVPEALVPAGKAFVGWAKADGSVMTFEPENLFTADTTFTACLLDEDLIYRTWVSEDARKEVAIRQKTDGTYSVWQNGKELTETTAGVTVAVAPTISGLKAEWKTGKGLNAEFFSLEVQVDGSAVYGHRYFDEYEDEVSDAPVVMRAAVSADTAAYAAAYTGYDNNKVTLSEVGTVTAFGTYSNIYATAYAVDNGAIVLQFTAAETVYRYTGVVDGKKLTLTGGRDGQAPVTDYYYQAAVSDRTEYVGKDNSGAHIYVFWQGTADEALLYYVRDGAAGFAQASASVTDGAVLTLTVPGQDEIHVKITGSVFLYRGAETGTYQAAGADALTLDGYTTATLGAATYEYAVRENVVVLYTDGTAVRGMTLDPAAKTYAELTQDVYAGEYTVLDGTTRYTMIFDGFGGAECFYVYDSGSRYDYAGAYTVDADGITVTPDGGSLYFGGAFKAYQNGKVLAQTDDKKFVYAAKDYVIVEPDASGFNGTWKAGAVTAVINAADLMISYDGKLTTFTVDYDNAIHFTADAVEYSAKLDGGKLAVTAAATVEFSKESDSVEFPAVITDENLVGEFVYSYTDADGYAANGTITIYAYGMAKLADGKTAPAVYSAAAASVTIEYQDCSLYRLTLAWQNGAYSLKQEYFSSYSEVWYEDWVATSVEKQVVFPEAFVGDYQGSISGSMGSGEMTLSVTEQGVATYVKGSTTLAFESYAVSGADTVVWTKGDYRLTLQAVGGGYALTLEDTLESYSSTGTVQKQTAAQGDALQGTWKQGSSNVLTADGRGNCTYNGSSAFTYTINGTAVTFGAGKPYNMYDGSLSADGSTLTVVFDDGDGGYPLTFTKQA